MKRKLQILKAYPGIPRVTPQIIEVELNIVENYFVSVTDDSVKSLEVSLARS